MTNVWISMENYQSGHFLERMKFISALQRMSYKKKHMAQGLRFPWTLCTAITIRNRSSLISSKAVQIWLFFTCCLSLISGYPKGKNVWFLVKMRALLSKHLQLCQFSQTTSLCSWIREALLFSKQNQLYLKSKYRFKDFFISMKHSNYFFFLGECWTGNQSLFGFINRWS